MANLPENKRRTSVSPTKRTMWIYGAPFSGKTTFADSTPNPLMLNTDGNAEYVTAPYISIQDIVVDRGRMTPQRTFAWEVFKEYVEELEKGKNTYQTIVIDLVNDTYEMCRLFMYDKLKIDHESDDSRGAWDKVRTEYLSVMRRVTHLPYENIILLSHETQSEVTEKGKEKVTTYKPSIQDKVANSLAGMVGIVGRAYVDNGKHLLAIKSEDTVFGGGRLGISDVVVPLDWNEIVKLFEKKKEIK